ncbi:hypothetical protein [Pseudarthrobacter chlorophenolicus]|uniref:hypothetical protein n=1 Tax=Pseudarthrobacter chlorophenolicus TaxID=85085 RepID=UPI0009D6A720|nr:hypothetical protein [Pseudarthrobacter chlorophenolicus]
MKNDVWAGRIFYGTLIAVLLGVFAWLAGGRILQTLPFLSIGAVYAFVMYRVVPQSARAFGVMQWTLLLNYFTLISVDVADRLAIPAAAPWFVGFLVGGIIGGHTWSGRGTGAEFRPRKRVLREDGTYDGGWRLALINAACAVLLLAVGAWQLLLLSPKLAGVTVLAAATLAGWALFRFPPPLGIRNGLLLVIPVVYFALIFIGGATGQMGLPHAWAYGALAGILIGGRYWTGPRLGAPRPPFVIPGQRRRRRKRRPKARQTKPRAPKDRAVEPAAR